MNTPSGLVTSSTSVKKTLAEIVPFGPVAAGQPGVDREGHGAVVDDPVDAGLHRASRVARQLRRDPGPLDPTPLIMAVGLEHAAQRTDHGHAAVAIAVEDAHRDNVCAGVHEAAAD